MNVRAAALVVCALAAVLPVAGLDTHDARGTTPVGPMGSAQRLLTRRGPRFGQTRFMIASDLHVLAPGLWEEGPAFEKLLSNTDGKLVREAAAVLDALERAVRRERPAFLLLAGDLTFNGARESHEFLAASLARIEATGVEVFVAPGNHDIRNPWARRFAGTETEPVSHIGRHEFREIYASFGYEQARSVHAGSLAYLAEAAPGVSLLVLDSNRYERNLEKGYPDGRGAISTAQRRWLEARLAEARAGGEAVLPVMHHSLLSHRSGGGGRPFGRSWIDMWPLFARLFWDAAAPVVFTGHAHRQDIAGLRGEQGEWIYDVATGALGSFPHPYRVVRVTAGERLEIRSHRLMPADFTPGAANDTVAPADARAGVAFLEYSRRRYVTRFAERLGPRLAERYGLDPEAAYERARQIALRRLAGDSGTDPVPELNEIVIDLDSGRWVPFADARDGVGVSPAR